MAPIVQYPQNLLDYIKEELTNFSVFLQLLIIINISDISVPDCHSDGPTTNSQEICREKC